MTETKVHSTQDGKTTLCGLKWDSGMWTGNASDVTCEKCKKVLRKVNDE